MITNKRKILRRSGVGEKGSYLPWSKEAEGAYIFLMKQVPVTIYMYLILAKITKLFGTNQLFPLLKYMINIS
jgi:hypothetical protein